MKADWKPAPRGPNAKRRANGCYLVASASAGALLLEITSGGSGFRDEIEGYRWRVSAPGCLGVEVEGLVDTEKQAKKRCEALAARGANALRAAVIAGLRRKLRLETRATKDKINALLALQLA